MQGPLGRQRSLRVLCSPRALLVKIQTAGRREFRIEVTNYRHFCLLLIRMVLPLGVDRHVDAL